VTKQEKSDSSPRGACPENDLDSGDSSPLDSLSDKERRVVVGLLNGTGNVKDIFARAGLTTQQGIAGFLARIPVARALQHLAPLLPDTRRGAMILAPYALARTAANLGEPGNAGLLAARDILALAGLGPVTRHETVNASLRDIIDAVGRQRGLATDSESATRANGSRALPAPRDTGGTVDASYEVVTPSGR
jgi:hypothetical protein